MRRRIVVAQNEPTQDAPAETPLVAPADRQDLMPLELINLFRMEQRELAGLLSHQAERRLAWFAATFLTPPAGG
jgi:hypothetical protein